jgi:hypothetical protein
MSETGSIHMGHGQMVDIVPKGADRWEIVFSEDGVAQYKAPPLAEVGVDAIDREGRIHPLQLAESGNVSSVLASGRVAGAYRVRVLHGDHFHTRESLLPGARPIAPQVGPHGGSLARFATDTSVEIKSLDAERWELIFGGAAPAADKVVVQAIGPRAENYQIRNLVTEAGPKASTLIAKGKIKDATHARLTLTTVGGEEIRSVPVVVAA